jgi:hypothetical protein
VQRGRDGKLSAQKTTTKLGVPRGNCFNASKEKKFIYEIGVVDSKE